MEQTIALIRQLADDGFYGSVTLKFEAGKVVVVKKEETIKPVDKTIETIEVRNNERQSKHS